MPYLLKDPIRIVSYDPKWALDYEEEKLRIRAGLGATLLAIAHIGSTSVPDLDAKPIVDMLAGVASLKAVTEYVPILQRLGYEDAQINPAFQRRLYCKGGYNDGTHHLHFVVYGSHDWLLPLRFRDYLRIHDEERRNYAALKQQLARKHGRDLDGYSEAKGSYIEAILVAAITDAT